MVYPYVVCCVGMNGYLLAIRFAGPGGQSEELAEHIEPALGTTGAGIVPPINIMVTDRNAEAARFTITADKGLTSSVTTLAEVRARALRSLIPPPRLKLSDWIEANSARRHFGAAGPGAALAVSKGNCRRHQRPDARARDAGQRRAPRLHHAPDGRDRRLCRQRARGDPGAPTDGQRCARLRRQRA